MIHRLPVVGLIVAFLIQAALLGWLIVDRALLLATGEEIRLRVVPVDPRDIFRGDYVVLSYGLSRLDPAQLAGDDDFSAGETIYVSLGLTGGEWRPVAIAHTRPDGGIALAGKVSDSFSPIVANQPARPVYSVDYGLERFFVPEGQGRAIEDVRDGRRVEVDVAVASSGRAALKRLLVDGEVRYAEKLF